MKTLMKAALAAIAVLFVFAKPIEAQAEAKVRIYAASWCGYCKKLRADLTAETGSDKVIRVDGVDVPVTWVDATKINADTKGIKGYPTTRISSEDGKTKEEVGGANLPGIKAAIIRIRAGTAAPQAEAAAIATPAAKPITSDAKPTSSAAKEKVPTASPAASAATKKPKAKLNATKPVTPRVAVEARQRYFDWMSYDDKPDDWYCFETDEQGNLLDANECPVAPEVCDEAYANSNAE